MSTRRARRRARGKLAKECRRYSAAEASWRRISSDFFHPRYDGAIAARSCWGIGIDGSLSPVAEHVAYLEHCAREVMTLSPPSPVVLPASFELSSQIKWADETTVLTPTEHQRLLTMFKDQLDQALASAVRDGMSLARRRSTGERTNERRTTEEPKSGDGPPRKDQG